MTTRPFKIVDSVALTNVADARTRLTQIEGCVSSFVQNDKGQSFQIYTHPDGRVFSIITAFARKRGALLNFTLCEVELSG